MAYSITRLGQGALLAKIDIKSAYWNVPIHPDDRWLMGMSWEGALYIDTTLPFGLKSAPKIFTGGCSQVDYKTSWSQFRNSLPRRFFGDRRTQHFRGFHCSTMIDVFHRLGFPIAIEKLEGPTPRLEFLGDSRAMEVRLSLAKLCELQTIIHLGRVAREGN